MAEPTNYDALSTDQLRDLAMQWANGATEAQPDKTETETPRDEHGRFVKKDEAQEETPGEAQEETIYERTIDLGDGSGVQVFQGKTLEELVDKIADAQGHATRKIRELSAQLKNAPKTPETPSPDELENLSEAEKFLLQQEMLTDPAKAIKKFVNRAVEQRERAQAEAANRTKAESDAFVANTSGYYASPKNGQKMVKWLETNGLEVSEENLKQAFDDLNESGLLESRPTEATSETPVVPESEKTVPARIEQRQSTHTVVRRKVVGGVSVKRSAPQPVQTAELTEEQLYKMPMHELEAFTRQQIMRGQ